MGRFHILKIKTQFVLKTRQEIFTESVFPRGNGVSLFWATKKSLNKLRPQTSL